MADKEETNAAAAGEVMPKENGDGVILDSPPANPAEEVETGTAKETPEVDGVQQLEDTNGPGEALADAEATASPVMGKDEEQPTSAVDADAAKVRWTDNRIKLDHSEHVLVTCASVWHIFALPPFCCSVFAS